VLEALWSRLPVITSKNTCLSEVCGDAAFYVDPAKAEEIAEGIKKVIEDSKWVKEIKERGWQRAQLFTNKAAAESVMRVYKTLF
jgi:glycosyltransferase involved in cell wall biosynthesis